MVSYSEPGNTLKNYDLAFYGGLVPQFEPSKGVLEKCEGGRIVGKEKKRREFVRESTWIVTEKGMGLPYLWSKQPEIFGNLFWVFLVVEGF